VCVCVHAHMHVHFTGDGTLASNMLGKYSTPEPHPSPLFLKILNKTQKSFHTRSVRTLNPGQNPAQVSPCNSFQGGHWWQVQ
jgi:hypothetical protein